MKIILNIIKEDLKISRKLQNVSLIRILFFLFFYRDTRALILIRLLKIPCKPLVILIRNYLRNKYHIEIGLNVEIGLHLRIPHPRSIIISDTAKIGNNVLIAQNVTIGGNNCKKRVDNNGKIISTAYIGDNVNILQGAVIGGPVIIGHDVVIGANAVVTKDIDPHSLVVSNTIIANKKVIVPGYQGPFYFIDNN